MLKPQKSEGMFANLWLLSISVAIIENNFQWILIPTSKFSFSFKINTTFLSKQN